MGIEAGMWLHTLTLEDDLTEFSDLYLQVEADRLADVIDQHSLPVGDLERIGGDPWPEINARFLRGLIGMELRYREDVEQEHQAWTRGRNDFDSSAAQGGYEREIPEFEL